MDAIKYLKKRYIMCTIYDCTTCPLGEGATEHLLTCRDFENLYAGQAIDIVDRHVINDNEKKFRAMWTYLSTYPEATMKDAIRQLGDNPNDIKNVCYACEEVKGKCGLCPLSERVCSGKHSLYIHWLASTDLNVKSELAKIISASEWKVRNND
jgi:hypothetical protein